MRKAWLRDMGIHLRIWGEPPRRPRPSRRDREGEPSPVIPRPNLPTLDGGAEAPLE
jgi:hypothetical protein